MKFFVCLCVIGWRRNQRLHHRMGKSEQYPVPFRGWQVQRLHRETMELLPWEQSQGEGNEGNFLKIANFLSYCKVLVFGFLIEL